MKVKLTLFWLLFTQFFIAQNFEKEWSEVMNYEIDGKIKSANELVEKIYRKAHRKKDEQQIIKCFFYLSKFEMLTSEEAQTKILNNLDKEINENNSVAKTLLLYTKARILIDYKNRNSYIISKRSLVEGKENSNFITWSSKDFENEIEIIYQEIFKYSTQLSNEPLTNWKIIFEIAPTLDGKHYSLYDYLNENYLNYLDDSINLYSLPNQNYYPEFEKVISKKPEDFINGSYNFIENVYLRKAVETFQNYEKNLINSSPDKVDQSFYGRVKYFKLYADEKSMTLPKVILNLEKTTKNENLKQQIRFDKASKNIGIAYLKKDVQYQKNALQIIDSILNKRINPKILSQTEELKNQLLGKSLKIEIQDNLYANENNRAFIRYKNVDTLKVNYYKIPFHLKEKLKNIENITKKDSILLSLISTNPPIASNVAVLPKHFDFFEHSTEILLEKVETGNYVLLFETQNDSISQKKVTTSTLITVSNFYVVEDQDEQNNNIYVLDKKTGKPIENVIAKSEDHKSKTNIEGKAFFPKTNFEEEKKYSKKVLLTKDNDTLQINYKRNFKVQDHDEDDENCNATVQLFTDRAIYRPGQKVFFKGIVIQNKNGVKSVVPLVTIDVYIEDSEDNELKKYELQTNEFGSFSGEFEIPKNILTGQFQIFVEEPENYEKDSMYYDEKEDEHKFWDYADFEEWQSRIYFHVEEYKRPTFEVTFDKITENYTIGDTLNIKGNAKALSGNAITNAKVKYTVAKQTETTFTKKRIPYEENFIVDETFTDKNGNFSIKFPAIQKDISNDSINSIRYIIKASITDSNGETRSTNQAVLVGKKMLSLNILLGYQIFKEEPLETTINATTLNNYPLPTDVTFEVYEIQEKIFLQRRKFQVPETNTISREQFKQLFPYEPYDASDAERKSVLIKTSTLNTGLSSTLDLSFLKNYKNGKYKIIATATDLKGNEIKTENVFNLSSKEKPEIENNIFNYRKLSNSKSNYIEVELYSEISDLWITTRYITRNSNEFNIQVDQLENGKKILRFKKNNAKTAAFQFSTIWEGKAYTQYLNILEEEKSSTPLEFTIESFKNKIEPGSNENWSFKINEAKKEAEVLATMYDTSLDQFAPKNWRETFFRNNSRGHNFPYLYDYNENKTIWFNNFINLDQKFRIYMGSPVEMNWFGFNFNDSDYSNEQYVAKIKYQYNSLLGLGLAVGVVSDEFGPISGANVVVKGTTRGIMTDFDGNYTIAVKQGETLVFSYVGKKPLEITVSNTNLPYNATLESDDLGSIVVEGALGIKRKDEMTTSYSVLKTGADLMDVDLASQSSVQTLVGKVSGLQINTRANGEKGIVINGNRSITGNNEALIVIDNKIVSATELQNLKVELINEIQVLKGAQGTVLYGEMGANGVIIVTTKNALNELQQVKTRINFNETAFFYPHLTTDKNGKIAFNFTTPESLTQWKLRLFGHNKNYENGYFETNIISQKDVMLQTNMPRFVRENDNITISAKVVNLTNETKSGSAMLMLFDAETEKAIDTIAIQSNAIVPFVCKPKESVPVEWVLNIPKNYSGIRYKVVAKSGNFSDGEENIIPVLSNRILLTESQSIWLKGKTKKEITFDNLLNSNPNSIQNQKLSLEYTANPIWNVLQSLPYLLEYEHECAEQTFARFYANFIASEVISSNTKIAEVLENWKTEKTTSKLNLNEDLKSILLNETPWLLDAESEEEKNKRLALLLDLDNLKTSLTTTLKNLESKQKENGAFSWFDGGDDNVFITQHIVSGLGHLSKMFPEKKSLFQPIISKAIPFLNQTMTDKVTTDNNAFNYLNLHYWYARSFYLEDFPLTDNLEIIFNKQFEVFQKDWLSYSLYQKGMAALCFHRYGKKEWAHKITEHLKESVATDENKGKYWLKNKASYYWHQSPIATQALLIEVFDEVENDAKTVEELKAWLISQKQTTHWSTTKSTTEAIQALLLNGKDWTTSKDNVKFTVGTTKLDSKKLTSLEKQEATGFIKLNWIKNEITPDMGQISIENKSDIPGYGGVYWQYFEDLQNIKSESSADLNVSKKIYKKIKTTEGDKLVETDKEQVNVGDLVTVQLTITSKENLEFVHLKDTRASSFEPVDVISKYEYSDGLNYYKSTRDSAIHFFFDTLNKGTYVLEYEVRVTNKGTFNTGIATIQSMYAPEFSSHSKNLTITIK